MRIKPLLIYLVDPVHNYIQSNDIWTIPLNILTIGSYAKSFFGDQVEIRMFKFPDHVLQAVDESPPDIIGTSNYIWNYELSKTILKYAKERFIGTVTVMGGPNITMTSPWMTNFLKESHCDYYITGAGEYPFRCLIGNLLQAPKINADHHTITQKIPNVWYLDPTTQRAKKNQTENKIENLDEIPSPFLNGMVDEFLNMGLMPMIETSRGCPFPCIYCDWGDATFGKVLHYSVSRVKADIEYCRLHTQDERLMIDDANFGLLGKHDLEIAEYIKYLHDTYGWPGKVIITWGQVKSEIAFKISKLLKDLCMMTQSSQSMNPRVLKTIKRKNISTDQWRESIRFCKEHSIESYGELMLPLPNETLSSYIDALRFLFDLGIDFINTNQLILLNGSEITSPSYREKYQFVTKWRLLENCYGSYNKQTAIEYQEMVVQTNTFPFKDYLLCRALSWLIQMSWNLRRHDIFLQLVQSLGVNPADFLMKALHDHRKAPLPVRKIFEDFFHDAKSELFDTKQELIDYYSDPKQLAELKFGAFRKLNTYYTSRVTLECADELLEYFKQIAIDISKESDLNSSDEKGMITECIEFIRNRYLSNDEILLLEKGSCINKHLTFHYDFFSWSNNSNGKALSAYYYIDGVTFCFFTDEEQCNTIKNHLSLYSGMNREYQLRKLQEPYHGIHKKHLLYRIKNSGPKEL